MKTTIQVGTMPNTETFIITADDVKRTICANRNNHGVVHKSNLNYDISIKSTGLASFILFEGLGNAWGTEFSFTFGASDYDPGSEVFFENGLFAMAKFFEGIKWRPYENMGGQEMAAAAAEGFALKIASDLRLIGLDVGRPVFPMVWNLSRGGERANDVGVEDVTVTIAPRFCGALYTTVGDLPEYRNSPRDVINALVFYASSLSRPNLTVAEQPVGLDVLFGRLGLDTKDYDIPTYQASAYGHFVERWPNFEVLDTEARATLLANQHIIERIEELLKSRVNLGKAAVEIIQLFDRTHGIPAAGLETPAASGAPVASIDQADDSIPR